MSEYRSNESLALHTNYKIGGSVSHFFLLDPESDFREISSFIKEKKLPYFILGLGSNCLAPDEDQDMVVLKFNRKDTIIDFDDEFIYTSAGVPLFSLLLEAKKRGWDGFEKLAGIPANIGGAIFMNAGTHLGDVSDLIDRVEVYNLKEESFREITLDKSDFSYRKNHFLKEHDLVIGAYWKLNQSNSEEIKAKQTDILKRRKATQPLQYPSCGSVFKNPSEMPAWKVVETLGLRGKQIGDAQVSEMHTNWIVNLGSAKASDVISLVELIETEAQNQLNIKIEREIRLLGTQRLLEKSV